MNTRTDNWDETVDIVVVGYGFAGAAASIEANDLGANILLVEKNVSVPVSGFCSSLETFPE